MHSIQTEKSLLGIDAQEHYRKSHQSVVKAILATLFENPRDLGQDCILYPVNNLQEGERLEELKLLKPLLVEVLTNRLSALISVNSLPTAQYAEILLFAKCLAQQAEIFERELPGLYQETSEGLLKAVSNNKYSVRAYLAKRDR